MRVAGPVLKLIWLPESKLLIMYSRVGGRVNAVVSRAVHHGIIKACPRASSRAQRQNTAVSGYHETCTATQWSATGRKRVRCVSDHFEATHCLLPCSWLPTWSIYIKQSRGSSRLVKGNIAQSICRTIPPSFSTATTKWSYSLVRSRFAGNTSPTLGVQAPVLVVQSHVMAAGHKQKTFTRMNQRFLRFY